MTCCRSLGPYGTQSYSLKTPKNPLFFSRFFLVLFFGNLCWQQKCHKKKKFLIWWQISFVKKMLRLIKLWVWFPARASTFTELRDTIQRALRIEVHTVQWKNGSNSKKKSPPPAFHPRAKFNPKLWVFPFAYSPFLHSEYIHDGVDSDKLLKHVQQTPDAEGPSECRLLEDLLQNRFAAAAA